MRIKNSQEHKVTRSKPAFPSEDGCYRPFIQPAKHRHENAVTESGACLTFATAKHLIDIHTNM